MTTSIRRTAMIGIVAATSLTMLAACGRGGDDSSSSSSSKEFKIAIATRNFTNPYWAALRDGAIAEGKAQGVKVNVQAGSSETDADGENAKISTLARSSTSRALPRR